MRFRDRSDAGRQLGEQLAHLSSERPVLLALPRGGVAVGYEVARRLGAPLEVVVAHKVTPHRYPEAAMGAVAEGETARIDDLAVRLFRATPEEAERAVAESRAEVARRTHAYRGERPQPELRGRTVVVIDDGIASGHTARALVDMLRKRGPRRLILAAPVCSVDAARVLRAQVDELVCVAEPAQLRSIGRWYSDFDQFADEAVIELLERARAREGTAPNAVTWLGELEADGASLSADLHVPAAARGLVVVAHGSGSGGHSARNLYLAHALRRAPLATLLVDLLDEREKAEDARSRRLRFDVGLLAARLAAATRRVRSRPEARGLRLGYLGASTGAAAALLAAAALADGDVGAVVSRGGRVDLAASLDAVRCPTLLIVGERDERVLAMNRAALTRLPNARLEVVPGATHLFEEPGALERVAEVTLEWFSRYVTPRSRD